MQLLGGFEVRHGDRVVSRFKTHKTALLLARLALFGGREHGREELTGLLWPDSESEEGRGSLRAALAALRRSLGDPDAPLLLADRLQVRLRPDARVDTAEFEATVRAAGRVTGADRVGRLTEAVSLYAGDLLPGYYEEWIEGERERLSLLYHVTMRRLVGALEEQGDLPGALEAARRALGAFPAEEETHLDLMRLFAALGRPDDARRQFQVLERALLSEGDGPPSEEARAILAALPPSSPAPASPRFAPLPLPLTRFFGRTDEIARVAALLGTPDTRLVTLTGPGGVGKTRLALETARRLAGSFPHAVLFVALADVSDGAGVPDALADALRLPLRAEPSPAAQIATALGGSPTLLVLDNMEQIAESAGPWVEDLLARAPALSCLVTSRQRLDVPGEREFPVLPLLAPSEAGQDPAAFPCVQLFVDRAQAGLPDFQITPRNAAAVSALCARLEGVPLALELAAGWAQTLTPAQMLGRLEDRFALLVSRHKGAAPRHRTLRDAIEWSYRLLSPDLQRFFVRLSVFRGGWSLEAALSVCEEPTALEMLSRLRARSLVVTAEEDDAMRFRMLESLREFAEDQGAGDKDARALGARRHAYYFLELAREAQDALTGPDQVRWHDKLEVEHANLRAALDWSLAEASGAEFGIQLVSLLGRFWYTRGHWREQQQLLEALLARPGTRVAARILALGQLGDATSYLGDLTASQDAYAQSLLLCERSGDTAGAAQYLHSLGQLAQERGDLKGARSLFERCLLLRRATDSDPAVADALHNLGRLIQDGGDAAGAAVLYQESLALARRSGDESGVASVLTEIAMAAASAGRFDEGRSLLQERLDILRRLGDRSGTANTLLNLSRLEQARGEESLALPPAEESLALYRALGHQKALTEVLEHLSVVCRALGDRPRAEEALRESREIRQRFVGAAV